MATGMELPISPRFASDEPREPGRGTIYLATAIAFVFVVATRWPVARTGPIDSDEFGFLAQSAAYWFPMHHTLFMSAARVLGLVCGDAYRGFIILDIITSAGAVVSVWWMLRAFVAPVTAAAAAIMLAVGPVFWSYGGIAANYTAIVLVGSLLLGVAYRGRSNPRRWHPFAAGLVLAAGAGYRPDIGTFWLPVFAVILWQHRWERAIAAGLLFTVANLAWLLPMLHDAGGWARYRAASAEFAHSAGYLNSVWNLGIVDGPVRYSVKIVMALVWTLGPALLLVPRGMWRLAGLVKKSASHTRAMPPSAPSPALRAPSPRWGEGENESRVDSPSPTSETSGRPLPDGERVGVRGHGTYIEPAEACGPTPPTPPFTRGGKTADSSPLLSTRGVTTADSARLLAFLLVISIVPALASHLLVHFGVAGYAFHYVPALMVLIVLGAGRVGSNETARSSLLASPITFVRDSAPARLTAIAVVLAAMFWCYPTDYAQPGLRGSFDLAFCRFTRIGLKSPMPRRSPAYWRTANSRPLAKTAVGQPAASRFDKG
jgi:hypothetical protein